MPRDDDRDAERRDEDAATERLMAAMHEQGHCCHLGAQDPPPPHTH